MLRFFLPAFPRRHRFLLFLLCEKISTLKANFLFFELASLYNLVNKVNLVQFVLSIFIHLYLFRAIVCQSSGETTVFLRHLVIVILCG